MNYVCRGCLWTIIAFVINLIKLGNVAMSIDDRRAQLLYVLGWVALILAAFLVAVAIWWWNRLIRSRTHGDNLLVLPVSLSNFFAPNIHRALLKADRPVFGRFLMFGFLLQDASAISAVSTSTTYIQILWMKLFVLGMAICVECSIFKRNSKSCSA